MKLFSAAKTLSPAAARNCLLMNQFATPGLGSLMGGRIIPGLGQLLLALAGFGLVMFWFVRTMKEYYSLMGEDAPTLSTSYTKFLFAGAMLFAASWLWSLLTSVSLVRQAKVPEPPPPGSIPPRITNIPPKI
jgi:hypothetical protein